MRLNVLILVLALQTAWLLGSMTRTGTMFLVSGIFLIFVGVYLEKKRRGLLQQIKAPPAEGSAP